MKVLVLCLLVALSASSTFSQEASTFGILQDVQDAIQKVLDTGLAIQEKIAEMIDQVNQKIAEIQQWYDDLKASTSPQRPAEYYLEQLFNKVVDELTTILDKIIREILDIFIYIVYKVDQFLEGVFGEQKIREALYDFLNNLLGDYIRMVMDALHRALEVIDFVETNDWAAFLDRVFDSLNSHIDEKLEEFSQLLKEKLLKEKPNPVINWRPLDHPNQIGLLSTIQEYVQKILDAGVAIQKKIEEMIGMVNQKIAEIQQWYDDLKASTSPQRPAEYYLEQLFNKVVDELTKILDTIITEILEVFTMVVEKLDEFLSGSFGENKIRQALYDFLHEILGKYVRMVMDALHQVLEVIDFVETNDWAAFLDRVFDSLNQFLDSKLEEFNDMLKEKLLKEKPNPVINWRPLDHPNQIGLLSTIQEYVQKILDAGVAIQKKIEEMIGMVNQKIAEIQQWYDDLKASTSPQRPAEYYLEQLFNKVVDELTQILDTIITEILEVFQMVVEKLDEFLSGIFGENKIRQALYDFLHEVLGKYVRMVMDALHRALEVIDFIETNDWAAFLDRVFDSLNQFLDSKLEEFNDMLKEKLLKEKPAPAPVALEPLVVQRLTSYGLMGDIENILNGVLDKIKWVNEKLNELRTSIQDLIQEAKDWQENIENETGKKPAEYYWDMFTDKVTDMVMTLVETIIEEVTAVLRYVIDMIDQLLGEIFGPIKDKIFKWLDDVIGGMIETIVGVIRNILEFLNNIEGKDWDGFIDHIIDIVKNRLDEAFEAIREEIRDKIGRN